MVGKKRKRRKGRWIKEEIPWEERFKWARKRANKRTRQKGKRHSEESM